MEQNKGLTFNPYRTLGTTEVAPTVDLTQFVGKQAKRPTQIVNNYFTTPTGNQSFNIPWKPSQYMKYQSMFQNIDNIPIEMKDPMYAINKWDAGYNGLSDSEKRLWDRENAPYLKGANQNYIDRMWRNQQFAKTFGLDTFYKLSPSERDAMYEDKLTTEAVETKYGTNENLNEILSLTPEGKKELLKSDYKNNLTIEEENNEQLDKKHDDYSFRERLDAITSRAADLGKKWGLIGTTLGIGSIGPAMGFVSGAGGGMLAGVAQGFLHPEDNNKKVNSARVQDNNAILENIVISDNERKKKDSQQEIDIATNNLLNAYSKGEITEGQINQEFDNIALNGKKSYVDELGNVKQIDYQGSNYYSAFKDSDEFEHFSISDKAKV